MKQFAPAFVIVLNTFIWYTLTYQMFSIAVDSLAVSGTEKLMIFAMYFIGTACSALLGATFLRCTRKTYLLLWMLAGALMTASLITIPNNSTLFNGPILFFLGVSLGTGFPSCLAYFADATTVETRGTCGGITWAAVGVGTLILALFVSSLDLYLTFLTLAVWRALGFVAFFLMTRRTRKVQQTRTPVTYYSILARRDMILYLIPWIMLSLVNFTETPILERLLTDSYVLVGFVEFALAGIFALVGGILADIAGRKRVIITGFVMLGIGYAVLSFSSGLPFSWYLYTACDGIAWGMFSSVFFITLWGDLAQDHEKAKYYVLGGLPFLVSGFLAVVVKPYVELISTIASFSLASFFLFLAVLPLMYAPETLPEKEIRDRELKDYIEKARKVKEKYD
ncbi:MAG: MFS transporter [Candidatus Bathyarchaeia archaeon]